MRRFLLLAFCGGISTLVGHGALSLGLHPGHVVPLAAVLEGCAALGVGAALFVTGMLGLADAYQKQSRRLATLLQQKQPPGIDSNEDPTDTGAIADPAALIASDERFWSGYLSTTGGLIVTLGGLLTLVILLSDVTYETYKLTVGAGIAGIAVPALLLWIRGFVSIRRAHASVSEAARHYDSYPEKSVEPATQTVSRPRRGAIFRSPRPPPYGRDLTRNAGRHSAPSVR